MFKINTPKIIQQCKRYYTNGIQNKFNEIEKSFDFVLPPYQATIIRLDGKSFGKMTDNIKLNKPHDNRFHEAMLDASMALCNHFIGTQLVYSFSDEINLLLYSNYPSKQFLSNRIQKLVSISSSIASVHFSNKLESLLNNDKQSQQQQQQQIYSFFDSRVFVLPFEDVNEYFANRQKRCYANCLNSIISSNRNGNGKGNENVLGRKLKFQQEYIEKDLLISLDQYPDHFQKGFLITKSINENDDSVKWICSTSTQSTNNNNNDNSKLTWFHKDPNYIYNLIK
ncbi:hypothetical protein CYY_009363 [Polysphondylium violaceum]|uniref:tRNAHis guanylyltransferase catalytic domain-containing protein n=1 Tax=Polysphondylium violaceum TaxID=133409 RepID=A0A8J4V0J9_9MYCE|nr:hypothetical protein CYY_009363 [Polysphondylium violaceum]